MTNRLEAESLDAWAMFLFEGDLAGPVLEVDDALDHLPRDLVQSREFSCRPEATCWIRPMGRLPVARLLLVGLGKPADATLDRAGRAWAVAARTLREAGCRRIGLTLPPDFGPSPERLCQALAEGLATGLYRFKKYQSAEEAPKEVTEVLALAPHEAREACERGLRKGQIIGDAVNFCRDVANEPPGVATPSYVAGIAEAMAGDRLLCTVLDEAALAREGMRAILAVGQGSVHPPRLVTLEYRGGDESDPVYAFVGKGMTFDSGGISIKPGPGMDEMKFDKCGACAVLGIMKAVSDLRMPLNVVGVAALAENMPSGTAYRPGDIIRAASGKTIEVLNTDAEGRLVLADALFHAVRFSPRVIVDLATLTGACIVALGDLASAVMGNDEALVQQLIAAGEVTGERLWQLPLWPEYDEKIKSEVADLKNTGERKGSLSVAGTIAGGSFLKAFVPEGLAWAHLDIAGTAQDTRRRSYRAPGATGTGVRLLVEWLSSRCPRGSGAHDD